MLALLAMAAIAPPVHSLYVLESGNGTVVCEMYTQNLNADNPRVPYHPNRPISGSAGEFRATTWNLPEGTAFPADAIARLFWERDANPVRYLTYPNEWLSWKGTSADIQKARRGYVRWIGNSVNGYAQSVSFRIAHVDIDNDGVLDSVARFAPDPETSLLVVLKEGLAELDRPKTELVMRHPPWGNKDSNPFRQGPPSHRSNANPSLQDAVEHVLHGAS
jgi:hypothetical protein